MFAAFAAVLALVVQDPAGPPPAASNDPVALEDIEVTGRRLEDVIRGFVDEVAEPNRGRGLARWDDRVCVGVANLRTDIAQYLADRVSTVAEDIGLETGGDGCTPNVLVIATDDGGALAQALVEARRRAFRMGGSGMDRGGAALREFVETDRPVRWWQMAIPVDSETGQRAVRIPGECLRPPCISAADYAPQISVFAASRINTQIVDNLSRTIVIVDIDQVAGLSALQLADYIAMVSLAQIDPTADTSAYASILNVFAASTETASLTDWDRAYLAGLYQAERGDVIRRAGQAEVVASIRRAHGELQRQDDEAADAPPR